MENTSGRFKVDWVDFYKTARGFLITLVAVGITAIIAFLEEHYKGYNYNLCLAKESCIDLAFLAVPFIGGIIEMARRWMADFRNK